MLTRLEVKGFKNLLDFALDFGAYTCIAGRNGVGKSNIFDAIHFISLLTDTTINDAALKVRQFGDNKESTGEIADLLFVAGGVRCERLEFAAEMLVASSVSDELGRQAEPSSSFLRYEVAFSYQKPSRATESRGGLILDREELRPITVRRAGHHLKFPHHKGKFRDSVVYNRRKSGSPYIATEPVASREDAAILMQQDGGSKERGRPVPAKDALRTIVGTENTVATPTILAARQEMRSWRMLALEPSAMRRPDRYTQTPGIAANGAHIPATLDQSASVASRHGDDAEDVYGMVASRLADLLPVRKVAVLRDDVRKLLSLTIEDNTGLRLPASAISDGTLRFLALAALAEVADECAVFCMEEPENGIHPDALPAMHQLLKDIAVDVQQPASGENHDRRAEARRDDAGDAWQRDAIDNPLRQVIVATHSPYFIQLHDANDLLLARTAKVETPEGVSSHQLECLPVRGAWRYKEGGAGVDQLALGSYLQPPGTALFPMTSPHAA